jgi:ParB family chromosome partitioning protein
VIITVNPQLLAMMGLQDFLKTVKKIKSRINDKLDVAGILLTMCDVRTNLCKVITEQVTDTFEGQIRIFGSKIPNTVKVGESVYYSEPLLEYAPECKACEAYENLAKELIAYEGKRKIFDAVDLLTEDTSAQVAEIKNGIEQIKIDDIQAFHDHPFHLYEGERLQDMVQSIKEHGVLNPVIVRKLDKGYEMLSGHNRANAAKLAGLTEVPAIVKLDLSDEEAYVYVIETNLMQRSFNDLMPSEKAAVMAAHYDKVCCQGKRNDIIRELKILNGEEPDDTCCHNGNKLKSLDVIAYEYGFSSRNAARYLRLNYLIQPFKNLMDENKIALLAAVDISYLTEDEQKMLWDIMVRQGLKIKPAYAEKLRKESGNLTEEKMAEILEALQIKHSDGNAGVSLKLPKTICNKYFEGMNSKQMASVVEQALAAWFEGKEDAVV